MAWIRFDDDTILNPKIGRLTSEEFRALLALWSFCSRRKNAGCFHEDELQYAIYGTRKGPQSVTKAHLKTFQSLRLVDRKGNSGGLWKVHDWAYYQPKDPTAAQRMRAYRKRNADRNATVTDTVTTIQDVTDIEVSTSTSEVGPGWIENLNSYTGCKLVRGSHGFAHRYDPLGTDNPPSDWPHERPSRQEIAKALESATA